MIESAFAAAVQCIRDADGTHTLLNVSDRFTGWGEYATLRDRLRKLADAAGTLNAHAGREKLLRLLADAGYGASPGQ